MTDSRHPPRPPRAQAQPAHAASTHAGHVPAKPSPPAEPMAHQVRALSEAVSVGAIMSRPAMCLAPEASVGSVTELFLDRDLNAAPVVDEHWLPLAMVSKTDLLRFWAERKPLANALAQHAPPAAAASPVPAAAGGRVRMGCPSLRSAAADAPSRAAPAAPDGAPAAEPPVVPSAAEGLSVADVTKPYVLSLHEEAPVSVAAALMAYENVHRLPIVSSAGDVVGVISALDIVRWLAQNTGMGAGAER